MGPLALAFTALLGAQLQQQCPGIAPPIDVRCEASFLAQRHQKFIGRLEHPVVQAAMARIAVRRASELCGLPYAIQAGHTYP
jgi:hypothetical protein